jgi:hypothetical protein
MTPQRTFTPVAITTILVFLCIGSSGYFYYKYHEAQKKYSEAQTLLVGAQEQVSVSNETIQQQNQTISSLQEDLGVMDAEIKLKSETVEKQSAILQQYQKSYGTLSGQSGKFTIPSNILDAGVGAEFSLPIKFQSGTAGNLGVYITHVKKYLPRTINGKHYVYTPTCVSGVIDCDPATSIPQEVSSGEAVVAIGMVYTNSTTNQTAYVVVSDKFLALIEGGPKVVYGSYLAKSIVSGSVERFDQNVFYVNPLSDFKHTLLVRVPIATSELILTYGVDKSSMDKALKFRVE